MLGICWWRPRKKGAMTTPKGIPSAAHGDHHLWLIIMNHHEESSRFTVINHHGESDDAQSCCTMVTHIDGSWWFIMIDHVDPSYETACGPERIPFPVVMALSAICAMNKCPTSIDAAHCILAKPQPSKLELQQPRGHHKKQLSAHPHRRPDCCVVVLRGLDAVPEAGVALCCGT